VEWTKGQARGPGGRRNQPRRYGGDSRRRSGRSSTGRRPPERSDYRIAVSNLPDRCHWSELKDHFRQAGPVVFGDVWGTRGVIEFKYKVDMEFAIKEYDGVKWKGHALAVEKDLRARRSRSRSRNRRSRRSRSRSDSRSRSRSRHSYDSRSPSGSHDDKKGRKSGSRERKSHSPRRSRSPKGGSRSPSTERKNKEANNTKPNGDVEKVERLSRSPSPERHRSERKRKHSRSRSKSNGRGKKTRTSKSQERAKSPEHSPVHNLSPKHSPVHDLSPKHSPSSRDSPVQDPRANFRTDLELVF